MIGLSRMRRARTTGVPIRQAKDECGTNDKDELKKGGSDKKEEEAGGKEQARFGTKARMFAKTKEMPAYDRPIKVLGTTNEVEAREKLGSRFKTSGRRLRGEVGFSDGGRPTHPNKPKRFKFRWVNQIDGFRPKQTQGIYLPCCQLDTTKFGPAFLKKWMVTTDQAFSTKQWSTRAAGS